MKSTVFCPRCHCWNDRSPLALAIRISIVVVFIAIVTWTAWVISKAENLPPAGEALKPMPAGSAASAGQPDVRF